MLLSHRPQGIPITGKWVTDENVPIERKLIRWAYTYLMFDRSISLREIGAHLKSSPAIGGYYLDMLCYGNSQKTRDRAEYLLDQAITEMTEERHALLHGEEKDPTCKVLSVAGEDKKRVGLVQKLYEGEYGTW